MIAPHSHHRVGRLTRLRQRAGFSLTELLVVIGIIVLLIGLLLVALKMVRAKALTSRTETLMAQFANACTAFQAEHGFYPGVIPEEILNGFTQLSYTENALLHMMGGYRALSPSDYNTPLEVEYDAYQAAAAATGSDIELTFGAGDAWKIIIDKRKIGEGPVINGKPYGPYFTPGASDIAATTHLTSLAADDQLPDLIDGWGQPIIYIRQARSRGPLVSADPAASPRPQFVATTGINIVNGVWMYLGAPDLGELGQSQLVRSLFANSAAALTDIQKQRAFAALLAHPAFYKPPNTTPPGNPLLGSPRGAFMLWSAGADGVFMSIIDGTGSPSEPLSGANIDANLINPGPRVLDDFDDVRYYGGG